MDLNHRAFVGNRFTACRNRPLCQTHIINRVNIARFICSRNRHKFGDRQRRKASPHIYTGSFPPLVLPSAASACMAFRLSLSIRPAMAQACISRSCLSAISLMILSASFRSIPPPQIFKDFQRFSPNKLMKRFCPGQLLGSFDQASQ